MTELVEHKQFHLLRGRVKIRQGREGLRAGMDSVLLGAAPCPAGRVLELGCGVGQALLCYGVREAAAELVGIERISELATLGAQNVRDNGLEGRMRVVCADFSDREGLKAAAVTSDSFDLVLCNPPFYPPEASTSPRQTLRQHSHLEVTPLEVWLDEALRYLRQFGWLVVIHRPERIGALFGILGRRVGDIRLLPVHSFADQPAKRVILMARKARRGATVLLPPLVMHEGEGLSCAATALLEEAAPLPCPRLPVRSGG